MEEYHAVNEHDLSRCAQPEKKKNEREHRDLKGAGSRYEQVQGRVCPGMERTEEEGESRKGNL